MKKTVLFLMNGFGVEQADSYSIYNAKLMPNLDGYIKRYLFSTIESSEYNFIDGYRLFSTGNKYPLTYALLDRHMEQFERDNNMKFYLSNIGDSRIQLFMYLENEKNLEYLKNFIRFIRNKKQNPIFLHIILSSQDIDNYKDLEHLVSKIAYDYDCTIATIVGKNVIFGNDLNNYMNMLKNSIGETWKDAARKFSSLLSSKTMPCNAKEFYVNEGFKIDSNDSYFIFNYDYVDASNLIMNISSITPDVKFYSMFPLKGIKYPMYNYPISKDSMSNSLKSINAKALVLTTPAYMPQINYLNNGLVNDIDPNISYARVDVDFSLKKINDIIVNSEYDLIVIDYHIENAKTVKELTDNLTNLDKLIGAVHDICVGNKVSLFISSLYGMKKEISVDNFMKAYVNLSGKLPVLVIDPIFKKDNFTMVFGNAYTLASTIYTNINNKYDSSEVLIRKKGYLSKAIKK